MHEPQISAYLQLRLLGSPSQSISGNKVAKFRSTKAQALLYYLAATGETHRRMSLVALFWPNVSEAKAGNSLRSALSSLRKLIPDQLIVDRYTVALNYSLVWVDTQQFTLLLQEKDDFTLSMQQHQTAVSLYAGDFLEGFHVDDAPDFDHWVTSMRERFRQSMIHTLMNLARWHITHRDLPASQATLSHLLTMAPGNEAAHRLTMQVLASTGQRAAAIQQFDTYRRYLVEELGVDPAPETMALYVQLLEGTSIDETTDEPVMAAPVAHPHSVRGRVRHRHLDQGDMPGRLPFHGRAHQLTELTNRLVGEQCALVVVSGIGGVGKTALAGELVHRLAESPSSQGAFTRLIWRALTNAPALSDLLDDWLRVLVPSASERLPEGLDAKLALLFAELDNQRALLVLDNVESIMATGDNAGGFRAGFDHYRQLLERMAHGHHQSCLLITTREVPRGTRRLATDYAHVYHLALAGLAPEQGAVLLRDRAVKGPPAALHSLVVHYSGNPLALKLAASTVNDLYGGDIERFLTDSTLVFDDVRSVLDQQFGRLSTLARDLLVWLAVNREPVGLDELWDDLVVTSSRRELLEAIRSLRRSSLLQDVAPKDAAIGVSDAGGTRLALHNVVMEYVSDRLLSVLQSELKEGRADHLHRYALCKVSTREYVQKVQKRFFLTPLAQWLVRHHGATDIRQRLRNLLDHARQDAELAKGYTGANVIHLMLQLSSDLQGENFSGLSLREVDLRSASLVGVDLRNAELGSTRFADSFGIVSSVAVSPDGKFLAAGAGRVVVVWRQQTLQLYMMFDGHPRNIAEIAFAPDGRHLAGAGFDGTISLWDIPSGRLVVRRKTSVGDLISIAFSHDGETLVGGGYNGRIEIWNWRRNEVLGTLAAEEPVMRLAVAPTGELLANIGYHGEIQVWDIDAQRIVYALRNENRIYIINAALAVGHSNIWTNQGDVINGWDWRKRELYCELCGHKARVDGLALSPDENQIASANVDGTITLWDVNRRQSLRFLEGHRGLVRGLTYTPDGHYLISGGYDETVRLWDTKNGLEEKRLQGHSHWIYILNFSPNGQYLAGATLTGEIYLWRGHDLETLHILREHKSPVRTLAFSPDSRLLAASGDDGRVSIWDVQSGEQHHVLYGHEGFVWTVAFDHSGHYLASGGHDSTLRLWDVDSGHLLKEISLTSTVTMDGLAFHPHQSLLACGDATNRMCLWEVETGRVVTSVAMASPPKVFAFSPDGRCLACGSYDGSVTIWEFVTESPCVSLVERCRIHPSAQCVWRLLFSPDGSLLAWNGERREIYVTSVTAGEVLYSVSGTHMTTCIAFSADGQNLLTDGSGFDVFVQEALTGKTSKSLAGHTANLTAIVGRPASSVVASSDAASVIKLWDVTSGAVLATSGLNGPYMDMNITGATGLTQGQRQSLLALGAVDGSGK